MPGSVIVAGARTPIGTLDGSLRAVAAVELGGVAIEGAVRAAGIDGGEVDAVVMGNAVQAGNGPNPARQAAAAAGLPLEVHALTINKLCLSGLSAIAIADQLISSGQHDVVVAGGMESTTRAPELLPLLREGNQSSSLSGAAEHDALRCAFDGLYPGAAAERYQSLLAITRDELDDFAALSHHRAADAIKAGRMDEELVSVAAVGSGDLIDYDEAVQPGTTREQLALQSTYVWGGSITPGSSAQPSDGGCAVVVMRRERAERMGLRWIAEIRSYGTSAGIDASPFGKPCAAIGDAVRRASMAVADLDLFEIDESCAGVVIDAVQRLTISRDRVNVNGGSIALGHPMAMTGARLVLTLALELRRRGGGSGVAAMSGGGGQGDALVLQAPGVA